jgi:hypothetical protein
MSENAKKEEQAPSFVLKYKRGIMSLTSITDDIFNLQFQIRKITLNNDPNYAQSNTQNICG